MSEVTLRVWFLTNICVKFGRLFTIWIIQPLSDSTNRKNTWIIKKQVLTSIDINKRKSCTKLRLDSIIFEIRIVWCTLETLSGPTVCSTIDSIEPTFCFSTDPALNNQNIDKRLNFLRFAKTKHGKTSYYDIWPLLLLVLIKNLVM